MGEQLDMQREDYQLAIKDGNVFHCKECDALTISSCEDVEKGTCFYCGSTNVSWDKAEAQEALKRRITEKAL